MERYLKAIQQNVLYEVIISKEDKSKKREIVHKIKLVFTSDQSFKHCLRF